MSAAKYIRPVMLRAFKSKIFNQFQTTLEVRSKAVLIYSIGYLHHTPVPSGIQAGVQLQEVCGPLRGGGDRPRWRRGVHGLVDQVLRLRWQHDRGKMKKVISWTITMPIQSTFLPQLNRAKNAISPNDIDLSFYKWLIESAIGDEKLSQNHRLLD